MKVEEVNIIIIISYTDMPLGVLVPLLLYVKETVSYRPDKNLYQPLKNNNLRIHYTIKERRPFTNL
jgi:5-enolpyruvylshikimate-3-phosphate synthase